MPYSQLGFDGGNLFVAELFSPMSQMLLERQNRLTVAEVRSVRVNDFGTIIKVLIAPQPQTVASTKRFFH